MIQTCLNHRQMTYDWCRNCNAKDLDCPEYLSDIEHARKSPRAEKLDEMPDYETANGVSTCKSMKEETTVPLRGTHCGSYSRPVEFRRLNLLEAQATTRHFLERFRRYQR